MGVNIVANAFWLTWMFGHKRSVLLCLPLHASMNTSNSLLVLLPADVLVGSAAQVQLVASTAMLVVATVGLVVATRGTLGYRIDR